MKLRPLFTLIILLSFFEVFSQAGIDNRIKKRPLMLDVNVSNLLQHTFNVECQIKNSPADSLVFMFPLVVPGAYNWNNAELYVENFQCFSANKQKMEVVKQGTNAWLIPESSDLHSIRYQIKTIDHKDAFDVVTKMAVSDSAILFNGFWVVGFFENYRNAPYSIQIHAPEHLKTTYQNHTENQSGSYNFQFSNYDNLARNPILFAPFDTTSLSVNGQKFQFSIFSENKNITARLMASYFKPMAANLMQAVPQKTETDKPYRFMMLFTDKTASVGALEQKNASTYCFMASWDTAALRETMQHVMAHEFLHQLTPLTFNSSENAAQKFKNYNSKHLWLYEGVTEYLSLKMMLQSNVISEPTFFDFISACYSQHKTLGSCAKTSLIDLSENVLQLEDENCFSDFYYRGSLLAFIMDVNIIATSKGRNNLLKAIKKYMNQNGVHFDEETFIGEFCEKNNIRTVGYLLTNFENQFREALHLAGHTMQNETKWWANFSYPSFGLKDVYRKDNGRWHIAFKSDAKIDDKNIELFAIDREQVSYDAVNRKLIYPPSDKPIELKYKLGNQTKKNDIEPELVYSAYEINETTLSENQTSLMKTVRAHLKGEKQ